MYAIGQAYSHKAYNMRLIPKRSVDFIECGASSTLVGIKIGIKNKPNKINISLNSLNLMNSFGVASFVRFVAGYSDSVDQSRGQSGIQALNDLVVNKTAQISRSATLSSLFWIHLNLHLVLLKFAFQIYFQSLRTSLVSYQW